MTKVPALLKSQNATSLKLKENYYLCKNEKMSNTSNIQWHGVNTAITKEKNRRLHRNWMKAKPKPNRTNIKF